VEVGEIRASGMGILQEFNPSHAFQQTKYITLCLIEIFQKFSQKFFEFIYH
jgi:hypothetical protein